MTYGIIGGDLRNRYLAQIFSNKNKTIIYKDSGIDSIADNVEVIDELDEFISKSDIIIGSIPLTRDRENLSALFLNEKINLEEFINKIKKKTFIAGMISDKYYSILEKNSTKVIDIMNLESFEINNAIPTAEGTIAYMILESPIDLSNSQVLVCGFGKCGKILADKLKGFGAKVTIVARKVTDLTYINAYGFETLTYQNLINEIGKFDFIVNTVPSLIIDIDKLNNVKRDALVVDIASSPGGVDIANASKLNIKTLQLPGLPGKVSPQSAAMKIYDAIMKLA